MKGDATVRSAPSILDQLTLGLRPWALLLPFCLGLYLPGLAAMPPLDRDEARFMQASRQMVETGDLIQIRFQDEARNKKPAGIYWLQAAAVRLFSDPASTAAWPYRIPSVLGATTSVLLTFALGARLVGRGAAFLGAGLLASSVMLVSEAHLAKTDATLLATVVAAQGALGAIYLARRDERPASLGLALIFWLAQGLGILLKGPVTPLISLLTVVALGVADRRWRWLGGLRPLWGVPLALAIVAPWLIAIQHATGGAFASEAVGHDLVGKLVGAQEAHGGWPGTYLLLAPVTFWPGSALLGAGAVAAWHHRREPAVRFLLAWLIPSWLLFELVPTKLPHYVLPLYPAIALLAARALTLAEAPRARWLDGVVAIIWAAVGLTLGGMLVALPIEVGDGFAGSSIIPVVAIVGSITYVIHRLGWDFWRPIISIFRWLKIFHLLSIPLVILEYFPKNPSKKFEYTTAFVLACCALLTFAPTYITLLPSLDRLWLSRSAAALVAAHPPAAGSAIDTVGYNEPSLVFLLGGRPHAAQPGQAAGDLAGDKQALALVAGSDDESFRQILDMRGLRATPLGIAWGINYSRSSRRMSLTLYRAEPK